MGQSCVFLDPRRGAMNTGDYASLFTPDVLKYIGLVVALLNIAVRVFVTQVPIKKSLV